MKLIEKTHIFEQEKDCCDGQSDYSQYLELKTQDGGGGNFLVLKTDRWALDLDNIDEFCKQLKDFLYGMDGVEDEKSSN